MQPPGLPSLILYDNFEWKTALKSHENFLKICDLTKIPAISPEEFETKFYGILKDNYHRKLNFRNLANIDSLKLCILSDVLDGKSIEKSYEDLSETFGAENIDYSDFDFWFYRLYHNNYDLNYDRKPDPEEQGFLSLPNIIHHEIIDNLDLKNQLLLRNVSKNLRNIVDQGKPAIKKMKIDIQLNHIYVKVDNLSARYSEELDANYREIALNYVMIILKNPKLRLNYLHIVSSPTDSIFTDFLKNLRHKISTKVLYLKLDCPEATILFLACMKPKFLEVLHLHSGNIDEIVKLDQWKYLKNAFFNPIFSGPIDYFLGLSRWTIVVPELTEEHLMKVREELPKSQNLEHCVINTRQDIRSELFRRVFSSNLQVYSVGHYDRVPQVVWSYTIPNSRNFLTMVISRRQLMVGMHRSS
ncbi:hypothetical protein B9Z55_021110 [Caenorhabditis nigoni]|uniref:F-box domain-containing protein n=1 Tax=Caenorhabditis nigoni TaxID=1611254 RepID=A0A2G5TQI3_9PELO|nr:hypothetical protein B9Z55_021110 [Caenorhabditis nigoni]